MACKYKYNNTWYSKEELKSILFKERGILPDGKLVKPEINLTKNLKYQIEGYYTEKFDTKEQAEGLLNDLKQGDYGYKYGKVIAVPTGKQPTQTRKNTTSIESVKTKLIGGLKYKGLDPDTLEEIFEKVPASEKEKEYTSQAEINLKIAALKEGVRKYPRSLIRSEVVRVSENWPGEWSGFKEGELPFQKIPSYSPNYLFNNTWEYSKPSLPLPPTDSNTNFNLPCIG